MTVRFENFEYLYSFLIESNTEVTIRFDSKFRIFAHHYITELLSITSLLRLFQLSSLRKTISYNCSIKHALLKFHLMSPHACTRIAKVFPVVDIFKSISKYNCRMRTTPPLHEGAGPQARCWSDCERSRSVSSSCEPSVDDSLELRLTRGQHATCQLFIVFAFLSLFFLKLKSHSKNKVKISRHLPQ